MKKIVNTLYPAFACFVAMTFLCGILYTISVTLFAQILFPSTSNGSIITVNDKDGNKIDYGSKLIAQDFMKPEYLIGRPTGPSNLSPIGPEQKKLVQDRIDWWHTFDPTNHADIPMDLITASGSGKDPHISPEAAEYQVSRIAMTRGITEDTVRTIINKHTTRRVLGFIGEETVNVLLVNLDLDGLL